ncbi:hypothetical protein LPJ61_006976 [Coemansia biformis]|uniref:Cas12f1-like TNB domain-containing protein n=1 Tax=Coemansia biformis TaxID=1286918 RepID=A0A9W8CNL3_9FUNG|nr:hypothetical protein LPJ61_006976 [Coemansia biformis]
MFGDDVVIIFGNWSAPMNKFHEPIRGVGWHDMLKRHGFKVLLIDEFRTSSLCPECGSKLEMFKRVPNPRPWQCKKRPEVLCHGLLQCTNKKCLQTNPKYVETEKRRLWNRDMAAVLNMRHILFSLRKGEGIPEWFKRGTPAIGAGGQQPAKRPQKAAAAKRKPATAKRTPAGSDGGQQPAKRPRKAAAPMCMAASSDSDD